MQGSLGRGLSTAVRPHGRRPLIDMSSHGGQNDRMSAGGLGTAGIVGLAAAIGGAVWLAPGRAAEFDPKNPLNPPAPPYWCPNRTPDRQYSANPEPGCAPLVGK